MLEAYATLSYLAARTSTVQLGALVTGVTYRHPGLLAKIATTLDVLSGGRATLGIGAAWYDREHAGLGVPYPSTKERFERLEEALQICLQMWDPANNGPYEGKYYQLAETLCVPPPVSRPRPQIMIGGGGEKKTLRMVAQYGDACNLFTTLGTDGVSQKLDVLRGHCEAVGRDYDEIQKTVMAPLDPGPNGEKVDDLLAEMRRRRAREALVIDEYGGTAGLVTFESLMERIVGDIPGESASASDRIRVSPDGSATIDGLALVTDVNTQFDLHIDEDTYTTIGGYMLGCIGRRPKVGDAIEGEGRRMRVEAIDGLRVARVSLSKPAKKPAADLTGPAENRR
jgi:F420-dependent oxidoreductase-like protein